MTRVTWSIANGDRSKSARAIRPHNQQWSQQARIPFSLIPPRPLMRVLCRMRGTTTVIASLFPSLSNDLSEADVELSAPDFVGFAFINAFAFGLFFFGLLLFLARYFSAAAISSSVAFAYASVIFVIFFFAILLHPRVSAGKKAEQTDKNLLFALKDLLLQMSSGVLLYDAFVHVAKTDYGIVSAEFGKVARQVNAGVPLVRAMESLAKQTKSAYLKKALWQLVNSINAGSSLKSSLHLIIEELSAEQQSKIRNYARELNLWSLVYMLFAVAIPTIGGALLIILSSFGSVGVTPAFFLFFMSMCFVVQILIIGFVKSRRPAVHF